MPGTVTLQVNRHWQAGYVGRESLDMNGQGSYPASVSHGPNAKFINPGQDFPFQLGYLSIRAGLTNFPHQGFFGHKQGSFSGAANPNADNDRGAGITAGLVDSVDHEIYHPLSAM